MANIRDESAKVKRVLITGANRGIGLEMCKYLASKGHSVIALCRESSKELERLNVKIFSGVDIRDQESLQEVYESISDEKLDYLINNAGVYGSSENVQSFLKDLTPMREQFEINTFGPLLVTLTFMPLLNRGSKVMMVSSRMASIEDNSSGGHYAYRASKAALNMLTKTLAIELIHKGIGTYALHPGHVQTRMSDFKGDIDAKSAAERMINLFEELKITQSGSFFHANGEKLPW